jgi:hypothetical protein
LPFKGILEMARPSSLVYRCANLDGEQPWRFGHGLAMISIKT